MSTGSVPQSSPQQRAIEEALRLLGIARLVLGIHQSAFPPGDLDLGYGSPHAAGGAWLDFVRGLGFNGLQLGPGGQISDANPSPYDGTAFARNVLSLDLGALARDDGSGLFAPELLQRAIERDPPRSERAEPARARRLVRLALDHAQRRLAAGGGGAHEAQLRALAAFRAAAQPWLELDALFEVLAERTGCDDPDRFDPALRALFAPGPDAANRRRQIALGLRDGLERVELAQAWLDQQARALRAEASARGLALFADLQVGWSTRDRFLRPELFTPRWRLGAPPTRTNPDGQPWGYPLLDPDQREDPSSPARRAFALAIERAFEHHEGLRVDHPHALVCPFIYPAGAADPLRAVQNGTRAFESPDLADPELARWAIARREDLDHGQLRYGDRWLRQLDERQVDRYACLFEAMIEIARAHGRGTDALAVEVLSTCPLPLARVLARHGLGRFVVTQKADVRDPRDVYRTDRASAADWAMLGNHDTPPALACAARWLDDGSAADRARYLAGRLEPNAGARAAAAAEYAASPHALAQAHLADLFLGPARNVYVYFIDLFGEREPFNRAGIVHAANWSLRLPAAYAELYAQRLRDARALDLRAALAAAVRARGGPAALIAALQTE